ncbi:MAG: hypothetical protein WC378_03815 [Opitutaceae bacterium]|jgi:Zn-dependent oligopeptidase
MAQNPIERLEHLLASLSVLVEREEMLEKDKLWAEAEDVQKRMLALMEAITPLAQDLQHRQMMPQQLSNRLKAIMAGQHRISSQRANAMKLLESQIKELKASGAQLKTLRPVYGKAVSPRDGTRSSSLDARG